MDGCQVGVFEQTHEVRLCSFLQSQHCAALEPQVGLEVLGDLAHQALEGQLADQQLSALLVLADLTQGYCSRAVPVDKIAVVSVQLPSCEPCTHHIIAVVAQQTTLPYSQRDKVLASHSVYP